MKPDDSLRALFETTEACFAVACYPDSVADIDSLITDVLAPFSLTIEHDARILLQSRLGADRALSRAEIEKLALFCLGQSPITLEKVESIVGDAADLALERIAEAAAEGRTQAAVTDFGRAIASGENAQTIIATTQRYFLKLHRVRSDVDAGQRLDDALKAMRPPLFFKQQGCFRPPGSALDKTATRPGAETHRRSGESGPAVLGPRRYPGRAFDPLALIDGRRYFICGREPLMLALRAVWPSL